MTIVSADESRVNQVMNAFIAVCQSCRLTFEYLLLVVCLECKMLKVVTLCPRPPIFENSKMDTKCLYI